MKLTDILTQLGGVPSIARELGVDENQASKGAAALLPAILGGLKKQAQSGGGVAGLGGLLGRLGGGSLLDDVLSPQPTPVGRGNDVLGQIFGSKDVSRAVAQNAATSTGVDPSVLKKMLPMLAMVVAGSLSKEHSPGNPASNEAAQPSGAGSGFGGLGGLVGSFLGGGAPAAGRGPAPGLGGIASLLDLNEDGNPLDDILRMMGKGPK